LINSVIIIAVAVFMGATFLVLGLAMMFRPKSESRVEDRLSMYTGKNAIAKESASVLARPLEDRQSIFDIFFQRFGNINKILEQADTSLTVIKLVMISAGLAIFGAIISLAIHIMHEIVPLVVIVMGSLPMLWVLFRRKRRLKHFAAQLPEAMEMVSRSLRAGQSLAFGFNLISSEMPQPISVEFGRVFEEQNLGIPMEQSLKELADRIPNLDLKFFVTAVILQRQTGGDLAEILDKIGSLIRDRFRIWGQIQALTGEGRLSGAVLLALPFLLFIAVYQLNPDYIMTLFTDPMGKKMLAGAIVMQILGALFIRKIINIKV
jgi:tight adherence protein B